VYKAQGPEFDAVWLLPQRDNRVRSRELIYTGITRARRELHVAGSAEVIGDALGRQVDGRGWDWKLQKSTLTPCFPSGCF
jgi:exodeoxyribonuclease V alpha subunit